MYGTRMQMVIAVLLLAGIGGAGTAFWAAALHPQQSSQEPAPPAAIDRGRGKQETQDVAKLTRNMALSRLNLRKLASAMQTHAEKNKGFLPPSALINKDGKAVLSWRVLLLPYLGERELYEQFKLSEPWDGPHNKKLLSKMPKVFAPPGIKTPQPFSTFYQVFVSPKPKDGRKGREAGGPLGVEVQAAFVQGQPQIYPAHFPDGLALTILIIEAGNAAPWTKPEDLSYAADKPLPQFGGLFPDVFQAAFANGEVHSLTKKHNQFVEFYLRTAITSNGFDAMNFDPIEARSAAADLRRRHRELRRELEEVRERLRMLREERDALQGRSRAQPLPDAGAQTQEVKKEHARLQKELDKVKEEIATVNDEIRQRLR